MTVWCILASVRSSGRRHDFRHCGRPLEYQPALRQAPPQSAVQTPHGADVNHTLIRSARLSFCAIALAAGCSVNEAGKIPCGDANNCPTDYGRCSKAGFCVVGTQPAALVKDSGDVQSAIAGDALASPLVVEVQDTNGDPVPGITIAWAVQSGAGSVSTASNTTGPDGKASLPATLGKIVGANSFTATAAGLTNSPATFTATGVPGPAASFQVSFPISVATHIPHSATVTAQDKNGNSTS